jgi:serpin B
MHRRRGFDALLVTAILVGAAPPTGMASASVDIAAADNTFGFRLLNAVQKAMPNGNVVLSPVSAALNLSMVLNGAEGQTRQEMWTALALPGSDPAAINRANTELIKLIRTPAQSVVLSVADSLWVDSRRARLRPDYLERVRAAYDAETTDLDFSNPEATRRINGWAAKETHDKIPKVIDRIEPGELLLLLNAVYFKGQWAHKFDKEKTQQREFTLAGGGTRQVPRMLQAGRFEYFETEQLQAIRLPFGTGEWVLEVLLPAKSSSLAALEGQLTGEQWRQWQAQYASRPGTLELPRFELKAGYRLNAALESLGMRSLFNPGRAQLTRMLSSPPGQSGVGGLSISSVLQSTYWKVDEEGSEAAAVTTTGVRATAVAHPEQPFHMIVDRPFFCAIQDQRTGALLFVGAIYDPTS